MKELVKANIEANLNSIIEGRLVDLSAEDLTLDEYKWVVEIIQRSAFIEVLRLPLLASADIRQVLTMLNDATRHQSTLVEISLIYDDFPDKKIPTDILSLQNQLQSRLDRNKQAIFGIHGGGNIGLGLVADIISKSPIQYNILATSNNQLNSTLINCENRLWLKHQDMHSTCINNISILPRDAEGIKRLYQESCLIALCVTETIVESISYDIAQGLIARYQADGSGVKILVLMNAPHCDKIVKNALKASLLNILENQLEVEQILSGISIIPTVTDRIVTPIKSNQIKLELKNQLEKLAYLNKVPQIDLRNFDEVFDNPQLLVSLIKDHHLMFHLFNAETSFSIYVPEHFPEYLRLFGISQTKDIESLEEIKNKYINGPHAVIAWMGGLFGYKTIADALLDPILFSFINNMMDKEISPILCKRYTNISSEELLKLKDLFLKRCFENKDDLILRVGRDPLRKLESKGRVRGVIELAQEYKLSVCTQKLEMGIAAAYLYALKGIDSKNLGCKKIREIYKNEPSFTKLLCYVGPAPSGNFKGFNLNKDILIVNRISYYMKLLNTQFQRRLESPFFYKQITSLNPSISYYSQNAFSQRTKNNIITIYQSRDTAMRSYFTNKKFLSGMEVDRKTGHLFYSNNFKPFKLNFNLLCYRHGETYGNCGQVTNDSQIDFNLVKSGSKNSENRIFQGAVDSEINQLTQHGLQQAEEVAIKIYNDYIKKGWEPDVILSSPLKRAQDTARPLIINNKFENKFIIINEIKEISFGAWDNRRVSDLEKDNLCHLFYKDQNALVKCSGKNGNGINQNAENFCDLLNRAFNVLTELNQKYSGKNVIMVSHSMFIAALMMLLGHGSTIENGNYLAFDGKRKDGSFYTIPHTTPILFNSEELSLQNRLMI